MSSTLEVHGEELTLQIPGRKPFVMQPIFRDGFVASYLGVVEIHARRAERGNRFHIAHARRPRDPVRAGEIALLRRWTVTPQSGSCLTLQPLHGYGIGVRLEQISKGGFQVQAGSLFPALRRLSSASRSARCGR